MCSLNFLKLSRIDSAYTHILQKTSRDLEKISDLKMDWQGVLGDVLLSLSQCLNAENLNLVVDEQLWGWQEVNRSWDAERTLRAQCPET